MKQRPGTLFVISGPSGVGKGTLVSLILQRLRNISLSVSATTRAPREGEVDGVSYHFLSDDEFDAVLSEDGFLEWANVHGMRYGTMKSKVQASIDAGCDVLLEIDVQGAKQVKEKRPDAVLIFIEPPSFDTLEERLHTRGTEDDAAISRRLETARRELTQENCYDEIIVNDDLDVATNQLIAIIEKHRKVEC
ncbi:MAG: guanylate kinase [Coriobacteriales bacterium]|nr:guanylate kinase [Coriobacteriales bacterium]